MKPLFKPAIAVMLICTGFALLSLTNPEVKKSDLPVATATKASKIQVAILLDVSGSMDGLIEQAKSQLWNMVNTMGKATCDGKAPQIEIALYEYGRDSNSPKDGYIKQLNGFISDLDQLSKNLFTLTTNGGSEYCGQVIYTSLKNLNWDAGASNYKVIFIAGNEDFLQGNVLYTQACDEARKKGVIVNTIYCGDRMQGIREHWNLNAECGNGSFTVINHNAKIDDIATPYDDKLFKLNEKLNNTYLYYGSAGREKLALQGSMDKANAEMSVGAAAKRIGVKGQSNLYNNSSWDLVDGVAKDSSIIATVDMKTLPEDLQNKTRKELQLILKDKSKERGSIQEEIGKTNVEREAFIAAEKAKNGAKNNEATLETEVEKTIKQQAKRFNMMIQ
jgi:hypothetical protein